MRIASTGDPERLPEGETAYLMEKQYIPIFDRLVTAQGMTFAKADVRLLEEGIQWADVVHFLVPFALTHHGIQIAERLKKPFTAAFHVQPENVSSSIRLGNVNWVNSGIYHWFHYYVYKNCEHIHCPSEFIAGELRKHGYTGQLHVISNGIDPDFTYRKLPKDETLAGKFVVLMIGRLSIEKLSLIHIYTGKTILKLLQDTCRQTGKTVVIITHNSALTQMADRVVHIKNGTVTKVQVNERPLPVEEIEW